MIYRIFGVDQGGWLDAITALSNISAFARLPEDMEPSGRKYDDNDIRVRGRSGSRRPGVCRKITK